MDSKYAPGQVWTYETQEGFEKSRVVIGSVEEIPGMGEVVCVSVERAPMPKADKSGLMTAPIHFVPFSREAIDKSLKEKKGNEIVSAMFQDLYENWKDETSGTEFMTVPLPMFLEMIAGKYDDD